MADVSNTDLQTFQDEVISVLGGYHFTLEDYGTNSDNFKRLLHQVFRVYGGYYARSQLQELSLNRGKNEIDFVSDAYDVIYVKFLKGGVRGSPFSVPTGIAGHGLGIHVLPSQSLMERIHLMDIRIGLKQRTFGKSSYAIDFDNKQILLHSLMGGKCVVEWLLESYAVSHILRDKFTDFISVLAGKVAETADIYRKTIKMGNVGVEWGSDALSTIIGNGKEIIDRWRASQRIVDIGM